MRYDLLALDLDGTTLSSQGRVLPKTHAAIDRLRARGVDVVLVTGRHHVAARPFHADLGLDTPAICCNGGYVYDFAEERVTVGTPMTRDQARRLLDIGRRHGVHGLVYTSDAMNYEIENAHMRRFIAWAATCPDAVRPTIRRVDDFARLIDDADAIWKFLISHDDRARLDAWTAEAERSGEFAIEYSWANRLDVVPAGNSKGLRLVEWAAERGIPAERIVAIGDNHNDRSMIVMAGRGVAMGNAEADVKAVADLVVADNDHDGIAEAIATLWP